MQKNNQAFFYYLNYYLYCWDFVIICVHSSDENYFENKNRLLFENINSIDVKIIKQ